MKNIPLETETYEWREKIVRAFERMKKAVPENVIIALVIAEKTDGPQPLNLSTHANTCAHVCADLLKISSVSLAAAISSEECETCDEEHSQN